MPLAKNNTPKAEIYALDAQGNTLAIYEIKVIDGQHELNCSERLIYGSSRLGMSKKIVNLGSQSGFDMQKMENSIYEFLDPQNAVANAVYVHPGHEKMYLGFKQYELNNHLGNVLSTVSDRKLTKRISDSQVYYVPDVRSATEYYPFGSMLEGWGCSQSFDCNLNTYSFTDTLLSDSYNTGLLRDLIKYPYYDYALLTGSSVSYYTEISGNRYLVFNSTTRNQPIMRRIYGVEDYKTYTARFRGRVTSGSAEITVRKYLKSDSTVYSNATSKVVSLNGTWKTDSISFTVDPLYRYTVHVRNSASFGTTSINIDFIEVYGEASASYLTCSEDSVGYRYGFNTQEQVDEIAGAGNHYTAMFWEYDPRLGRRWNQDPKPNPSISNYAAFANNPILWKDILGDTLTLGGDVVYALVDIQSIIPKEYSSMITLTTDNKVIFNNYESLPEEVKDYEGVKLLQSLITSTNNYKYTAGDEVVAQERLGYDGNNEGYPGKSYIIKTTLEMNMKNFYYAIDNFSVTPRSDVEDGDFLPEAGFKGSVRISKGTFYRINPNTGTGKYEYPRNNIIFHELYENWLRTEKKKDYIGNAGAHKLSSLQANKFSKEVNNKSDVYGGAASGFESGE